MGCSPSKGQLFAGIYNHQDKALQFGSYESDSHHFSGKTEIKTQTETEIASSGLSLLQEENNAGQLQGKSPTVCDIVQEGVDMGKTNVHSQEELLTKENKDMKDDKRMKNNECKRSRQRARWKKTVCMHSNLDPPQAILKAQQASYAYLKHNIPKYESLIGLLEKTTQTQLSLQPMVTLLALQYEEINQALDEIATQGEQMLKMYVNYMTLPTTQNDILVNPDIPEAERNSTESSPYLMQHMLYHLIKKMRLVESSVKELGDTSLKETSDYFGSFFQLLAGKMEAKRAAELRLNQVFACMESYALRKPNSEDTALHSEDSGIGVENDYHNSLVRRCSRQESSGSRASTQSSYGCPEGRLLDNKDEEPIPERGDKTNLTDKKLSNWFQANLKQYPLQINLQNKRPTNSALKWSDQKKRNIRRPKTADDLFVSCQRKHKNVDLLGPQRSRSADSLCGSVNDYMVQEWNRLPNEWITKQQNASNFDCLQDGNNGPFKPGLTTSLTPAIAPVPPGKNSVRRLINTFSQGHFDSSNQKTLNGPTRFRGSIISSCRPGASASSNNKTKKYPLVQQFSERPDDVDVNSFPPPPPEVLMDNSFDKSVGPAADKTPYQRYSKQRQRCTVDQCPKVSLLLSQGSMPRGCLNISENGPNVQDVVDKNHPEQDSDQPNEDKDKEKDEAFDHIQHAQSINHLCHSPDILTKLAQGAGGNIKTSFERVKGTGSLENKDSFKASTFHDNSNLALTPLVSRVHMPTSSSSTCHRGPSPTLFSPSSTSLVNGQGKTSTASFTFQTQRWTRRDSDDENGFITAFSSKSFYDSVFRQENHAASQLVRPSCRSTLPRPWGESKVSKGRLQATCLPQTLGTSFPSRPSITDHQHLLPCVTEFHSEATTLNNGR